jgi:thiosulfate dehydrogenase (quinone) large subunit
VSQSRLVPLPPHPCERPSTARTAQDELRKPGAFALPLRLFIGVGWLRAFAEKLADPGWRDGSSLHVFLAGQIDDGQVSFSLYLALMRDVFMPGERLLDWTISIRQLLAGIALVTGTLTNAALLGGIFMNLNFMLAGRPDPSAFYLIIQSALLFTNAGATLGVDGWLSRNFRLDRHHPILGVAIARHRPCRTHLTLQRRCCLLVAALSLGCAGFGLAFGRDFSAGGSVKDPALVLVVLALTWAVSAAIGYVQCAVPRPRPRLAIRALPVFVEAIESDRTLQAVASGASRGHH